MYIVLYIVIIFVLSVYNKYYTPWVKKWCHFYFFINFGILYWFYICWSHH